MLAEGSFGFNPHLALIMIYKIGSLKLNKENIKVTITIKICLLTKL